jgi:hypothetical protein
MGGMIVVRPDAFWSTSSRIFRFVLRSLMTEITDPDLVTSLVEIQDANLGMLSLLDLPPAQRAEAERVMRDRLIARSEQELPTSTENRAETIDHIRGLVDMLASESLDQTPGHAP